MLRFARLTIASIAVATLAATASPLPSAAADPLGDAKARAAALNQTIDQLNTEAEVASEHYDAVQAQLQQAVTERGLADQALTTAQAQASVAQSNVIARARSLYEGDAGASAMASLLTGNTTVQAIDGYRLANDVVATESRHLASDAATVARAQDLAAQDAALSRRVVALQTSQEATRVRIQTLLDTQRAALADANSTVRRIMKADAAAAAAAQAADFAGAIQAAGGTLQLTGGQTPPNPIAATAIAAARSRLGVPYVWGATGPTSFDCSGLTQWSYAHAGITLPRTAAEQWSSGPHPSLTSLEPGDLLFWALNTSDPATIHHVAIYIGDGMMIAAPHTGENVQIQPVYMDGFIGATRPWATTITS
jgi:peptidoglycan DL-endopeptidase CwlO